MVHVWNQLGNAKHVLTSAKVLRRVQTQPKSVIRLFNNLYRLKLSKWLSMPNRKSF